MSAGGSALPCATPSSAPIPSFSICSRSSTSQSSRYSAAICRAASAMPPRRELVGGLVHQAAREVLRFGENARRARRRRQIGGAPPCTPAKASTASLVVARLVPVGFEFAQDGALHGGRGIFARRLPAIQRQGDSLQRLGLQVPHRRPGQLAHLRGIEFVGFPGPGQKHPLRRHSGGLCNSVISSGLPVTSPESNNRQRRNARPSAPRRRGRSARRLQSVLEVCVRRLSASHLDFAQSRAKSPSAADKMSLRAPGLRANSIFGIAAISPDISSISKGLPPSEAMSLFCKSVGS